MQPKSTIPFHYDGCGYTASRDYAAVNVKIRTCFDGQLPMDLGPTHPAFTQAWIASLSDRERDAAYEAAIGSGWTQLQEGAANVYGQGARVWCQGRSGGWAIVAPPAHPGEGFTRAEVESWDAIALGKFWQWTKYAEQVRDDVMYQYFWQLYYNVFEPQQAEARARVAAQQGERGTWADVR